MRLTCINSIGSIDLVMGGVCVTRTGICHLFSWYFGVHLRVCRELMLVSARLVGCFLYIIPCHFCGAVGGKMRTFGFGRFERLREF